MKKKKIQSYNVTSIGIYRKNVQMNSFAKQNREADVENNHMEKPREKRGGLNWEVGIDKYTLQCIK